MKNNPPERKTSSSELFDWAFDTLRDPRSIEYKEGVRACLAFKFGESDHIPQPFAAGTSQADAYSAGIREGHDIYRSQITNPAG